MQSKSKYLFKTSQLIKRLRLILSTPAKTQKVQKRFEDKKLKFARHFDE